MQNEYEIFLTELAEDEWPPRPEIISAFRSLLDNPSIPASKLAKESMSGTIAKAEKEDPTPHYSDLWSVLIPAVERFPEQGDRLVDFVIALHELPDCDGQFRELNGLSIYLSEFTFNHVDNSSNVPERDIKRQGFINANIFTAKLYLRLPRPNKFGFLIEYGAEVLLRTFEAAPWEEFHFPRIEDYISPIDDDDEEDYNKTRDEELGEVDVRILNGWVPAAAVWIEYCGKEIYKKEGSMGWEAVAFGRWTGPKGWSKERWAYWKKRAAWVSTVTALDRKTRRIAKSMMERMERIEGGGGWGSVNQ
ncbi:hypothetical protein BO70DRAFT_327382 [Aspergillus heteromorphus CBS 117.55]|uniref:Uncharacterized protein n=1 Tax=Aspergillus heteromorphus CBS 117.55 TaxID=1448321 RepID=A0A317X125_9EURO|nr:uncharacterized protein BO70DRAFT_327382 [Aspergillus heteromorphus CBS 117.55]PWY92286.1 hypothetical protein BO70DRAFT_327382 [Aspergillus heteromorphus CBS 117.55]